MKDFRQILKYSRQIKSITSGFFASTVTRRRRRRRRRREEEDQDENNDDDGDEKLLFLESPPEMNEDMNNNNDDDFEEEDRPPSFGEEEEKPSLSPPLSPPRIDIVDEADRVCFQTERVVHRLMSSLASEICRDEAPIEYYDLHVPLHEWSEKRKYLLKAEKTRSIRLNTITFARVIAMLNLIHTNVRQGKTVTQREMYYCASAKEPLLFSKVVHVLNAIKDIAGLLRIDRGALNITSASKGLLSV